jgi:hypothetical protein
MKHTRNILAAAATLAIVALPAGAQETTYPQTLYWGAGLVDIPTAWVSPITGDFAINYSGKRFQVDPNRDIKINYNDSNNSQLTFSLSLFRRFELGWAAYSANPEYGFFGTGLIIDARDFEGQTGLGRWVPSIGIGARNVGPFKNIGRFGVGYDLLPPDVGQNMHHIPDSLHRNFDTQNTIFGVATKDFSLRTINASWPDVDLGVTVGYGNGLFKDDGGLTARGIRYSAHDRNGLFYGAKADFNAGPDMHMTVMAEDNSWDYNIGVSLDYRGILAGLYLTEVGAGSANLNSSNPASYIYGYQKVAFTLGWQSNVFALLRGNFLQNRAAALEQQRQGLLAEITRRQQRIAALELEINRYEAQNLLELEQRRATAEAELRAEREALQRLEQRLRRVEQQLPNTPAPTTPPSSTPTPSSPPPSSPTPAAPPQR